MCRMWLLVVAVVGAATGTASQCWDRPQCQDLSTESNMLECLQLCHSDLSAETPILPGEAHLLVLPLSPSDLDSSSLDLAPDSHGSSPSAYKRSYSMEHFRWGKPVGRKRRPVKVPVEEVLSGSEVMRRQLEPGNEVTEEEEEEQQQEQQEQEEKHNRQGAGLQEKKDGAYRMSHFRWSGPPASKRYGGFMKSWDERSQKPLLTLFKNIINKDGQQQRRDA